MSRRGVMRVLAALVAAVAAWGAAATARAESNGWAKSFAPAAVGSYLDGTPRVLVAGVGASDADAAAEALRTALRSSGRAKLVIDDSALGEIAGAKDAAIVKRAASQPVEVVAVVRLFPGDKPTAVVTFYDKKGETLSAFSVEKGAPLVVRGGEGGLGVSNDTQSAVSRVLHGDEDHAGNNGIVAGEPSGPKDPKEQEYERRHVGFYTNITVNFMTGRMWGQWGGPYLGDGTHPLDAPEYFRTVGRADLADFYTSGSHRRTFFGVTGSILLAAGAATALSSLFLVDAGLCQEQDSYGSCIKRDQTALWTTLGVGLGAVAIGVVELVIMGVTPTFKTTEREAYALAAAHNRKLRRELGLAPKQDADVPPEVQKDEPAPESLAPSPPTGVRRALLLPTASPHGAGLALELRF